MNTTKIPILKKRTSNYVELLILMDMGVATLWDVSYLQSLCSRHFVCFKEYDDLPGPFALLLGSCLHFIEMNSLHLLSLSLSLYIK